MSRSSIVLALHRQHEHQAFAWGSADCATLAADCARAITGADPLAPARGRYSTALGAKRTLTRLGWMTIEGFASAHYAEIPAAMALVGDWVTVGGAAAFGLGEAAEFGETALAITAGADLIARAEGGLVRLPRSAALRAWRVA